MGMVLGYTPNDDLSDSTRQLLREVGKDPESVGNIIRNRQEVKRRKNVSREFQSYGCRLAGKLGVENPSVFIKAARDLPRGVLEQAFSFVVDYPAARDKQKLFFWKVNQILKGG
jgi:hypothetical protein